MSRVRRIVLGWLSVMLVAAIPSLMAAPAQAQWAPTGLVLAQNAIDLKQAVEIARRAFGGEVVKAEEVARDGRRLFQIRLVNNGRVRDVLVDGESGEILNP
ncbi:PepSY domain-containing protein [Marinobacterium sp. D7]|uniref:PepSY domain-containing protein n=1 Tax=Marinobacterium ramblicola TaxID=2849041 RepID=UPI001C2D1612|nr:PepSY domain-containing protein [Marinobacterium ramblicola]MBV1790635.1 PepSY domain-containing protein [Marinobacterium ramblicola]